MTQLNEGAPRDPVEIDETLWYAVGGHVGWDVGANMGQSVAKMIPLFDTAIVAFEPAVESFQRLDERFGSTPKVTLYNEAVSNHDGILTLAVREAPIMTGQLVSPDMPYENELPREYPVARWGATTAIRRIPCRTIDTLITKDGLTSPDFVKVDTEGHELQVLTGALAMLGGEFGEKPSWLIEFHREDLMHGCVQLLKYFGYGVAVIRHPHYSVGSYMYHNHGWLRAAYETTT